MFDKWMKSMGIEIFMAPHIFLAIFNQMEDVFRLIYACVIHLFA